MASLLAQAWITLTLSNLALAISICAPIIRRAAASLDYADHLRHSAAPEGIAESRKAQPIHHRWFRDDAVRLLNRRALIYPRARIWCLPASYGRIVLWCARCRLAEIRRPKRLCHRGEGSTRRRLRSHERGVPKPRQMSRQTNVLTDGWRRKLA